MQNLDEILQFLISQPRETLTVELKSWFDPNTPEGQRKIARAALALRNQNGGFLVIGFNDKTRQPDPLPPGENVNVSFHGDIIQRIVSTYASPPFVVDVQFPKIDGITYPVVVIPPGVKTPVVCKANLCVKDPGGKDKFLLREKEIYVRTVATNLSISSASGNSDMAITRLLAGI